MTEFAKELIAPRPAGGWSLVANARTADLIDPAAAHRSGRTRLR